MKKEQVPQDEGNLSKSKMREVVYAIDENGNYTTELSTGWEPKSIALSNSIDEINIRIEKAKEDVKSGIASPIVYFMELNKMDLGILAGYVGMWRWRVKRHFKPTLFKRLNDKILDKYATVFDITLGELKNFKGE